MHTYEAAQVTHTHTQNKYSEYSYRPLNTITWAFTQPAAWILTVYCYWISAVIDFRLDGSAEPSNEILEQGSHERPLVAQTYSAAVTKGVSHKVLYTSLIPLHFCFWYQL